MNKEELVKEIINNFETQSSTISCLVGKNATGKTLTLNDIFKQIKDDKNFNCVFFRGETTFQDELSIKQNGEQLLSDIKKFIETILCLKIEIKQNDILDKLKNIENELHEIGQTEYDDEYFVEDIMKSFSLDQEKQEKSFYLTPKIKVNKLTAKFSSGQGMYTLLRFCGEILKKFSNKNEKKNVLIVDEPEKFCHRTLIKKIFNILYSLSEFTNFFIIFSTHSPYLLNEFIKRQTQTQNGRMNLYFHNKKGDEITIKRVNLDIFDDLNRRHKEIVVSSLFDENIFLVEGLKDFEFVNCIIENDEELKGKYFNVYDCTSKSEVKKIADKLDSINVKSFSFFDKDCKVTEKIFNKARKDSKNDNLSDDDLHLKLIEDRTSESNKFKEWYDRNNIMYYEFEDCLEEAVNDPNNSKNNLSHYIYENIEQMNDFKEIKIRIKKFLGDQND